MKVRVVAVGKLRAHHERQWCDQYQARIARYVKFEEVEVRDAVALVRFARPEAWVVALEVSGCVVSSSELATRLERWLQAPRREIVFLIGGAEGLPQTVSEAADVQLSLSSLTLPHRLARVVLCEQLYRAFSILRNEPYAREE